MIAATDEERRIIVTSGGVPVAISTLLNYAISLYAIAGNAKELLFTYTKSGVGEKQIFVEDDAGGKLIVVINRNWTQEYKGKFYLQFDYQLTANARFINGKRNGATDGFLIETLKPSANPKIIP